VAIKRVALNPFHSLRTQLFAGAIALLGITVASTSYFLINHEVSMLRGEIQKSVALQGRNIALGSERALLRSDPEFELYPLVKSLLDTSESIESVIITDADGVIYGHSELKNVSKRFEIDLRGYEPTADRLLAVDEALYQSETGLLFETPVRSSGKIIGYVYLRYSKEELDQSIRRAVFIALQLSVVALALGTLLSLVLFRRISDPMERLMDGVQRIGEGQLSTKIKLKTRNEFKILAESFNEMTDRIARTQEELLIKERMQKELEIAKEIQATLIPKKVPQPFGFDIALYYEPATEVGGDYADVIPLDSHRLVIVMADVAGKGVPGLVVMGMLKIMVHTLLAQGKGPAELVKELNVTIRKTTKPNMFVTLFVARLDTTSGELVYSNAGHNPLVIYDPKKKKCTAHKMAGPPLGVFPGGAFDKEVAEYRLQMPPGMVIVQYTDGLNESLNAAGQRFGIDRTILVCEACGMEGAESIVPALARAEQAFRKGCPQPDDIALVAVGAKERIALSTAPSKG
jgi:serine phosphatase RsbU (regulator of sigma subunit)